MVNDHMLAKFFIEYPTVMVVFVRKQQEQH